MHSSFTFLFQIFVALSMLAAAGCGKTDPNETLPEYGKESALPRKRVEYVFAVHPLHNSRRYFEIYQPVVDYINRNTEEFSLRLETSKDYTHFEEQLFNRKYHFALPNPYQSISAVRVGYSIFGKMGDDDQFRGIIVVRKESRIRSVEDLRGKPISFPSATALAASMMPKYFLKMNGLDVDRDAECRYVGSQESSMMNVYLGQTIAGCTWPPPWESFSKEYPDIADDLTVRWKTDPLINNGLVVRNDVPATHRAVVARLLFELHTHPEGRALLQRLPLTLFEPIPQQEYVRRVNTFLRKYEAVFGSLPSIGGNK
jgi:phosphonate transport system substrate-binding protein